MAKHSSKRSKKSGLPPGTLVYLGDRPNAKTEISILRYNREIFEEKPGMQISEIKTQVEDGLTTWINVAGVSNVEDIRTIGKQFSLHPLLMEDVVSAVQRPKIDDYPEYKYIVVNHIKNKEGAFEYISEQINIVLGRNFILTFEEGEADFFAFIKSRLKDPNRFRTNGTDYLVYLILDAIVDNFFGVLEQIGEDIEKLEEEVVNNPTPKTLSNIYRGKRSLLGLRRSIWPLREVLAALHRDNMMIAETTRLYLRDVYDHAVEVIDLLENFRDMSSGMLDVYLSSVSNRMNSIMKILTIITTIFIPLTFIVGVYGMNFEHMPELASPVGYPLVWAVMIAITLGMTTWFRRKGWFE